MRATLPERGFGDDILRFGSVMLKSQDRFLKKEVT